MKNEQFTQAERIDNVEIYQLMEFWAKLIDSIQKLKVLLEIISQNTKCIKHSILKLLLKIS